MRKLIEENIRSSFFLSNPFPYAFKKQSPEIEHHVNKRMKRPMERLNFHMEDMHMRAKLNAYICQISLSLIGEKNFRKESTMRRSVRKFNIWILEKKNKTILPSTINIASLFGKNAFSLICKKKLKIQRETIPIWDKKEKLSLEERNEIKNARYANTRISFLILFSINCQ